VTTSEKLADQVIDEIYKQAESLERKEIILESINNQGAALICSSREEAVRIANKIAPEHLEVQMRDPLELIGALDNAGSVFLGDYASEPLGDYYAGPNHVLPTSGTARFFSPLGVYSFTKRSSYIYYTKEALEEAKDDIELVAKREGLTAHAHAIAIRFEEK
jgi:histidinol dehydrogenase